MTDLELLLQVWLRFSWDVPGSNGTSRYAGGDAVLERIRRRLGDADLLFADTVGGFQVKPAEPKFFDAAAAADVKQFVLSPEGRAALLRVVKERRAEIGKV